MITAPKFTVELTNFAGPLDLLLSLIERRELEITEVSVGQVTGDYLRAVSSLEAVDERELLWFLDIATQLLHHKSRALRTRPDGDETAEESGLAELAEQLQRLQAVRRMADLLAAEWGCSWQALGDRSLRAGLPPRNLSVGILTDAWRAMGSRRAEVARLPRHRVTITKLDIATASQRLVDALRRNGRLSLTGGGDRHQRVERLLALLELIKQELVEIMSEGQDWYAHARG